MKKIIALFALLLVFLCSPKAMAQGGFVRFEKDKAVFSSGESAAIYIVADEKSDEDRLITVTDDRGNTYQVLLPAGEVRAMLDVSREPSASGNSTTYTIAKSDQYMRKNYTCVVMARAATMYTFNAEVYQAYVGRKIAVKVDVIHSSRLDTNTRVELRDENGHVLETILHRQNRTAYLFEWETDETWYPGKKVSLWVDGREQADDEALLAVGVTGGKSIYGVKREDKKIAFTMDCGSGGDNLPGILDILDEYGLKITFFMTGKFVEKNPETTKAVAERGHEIGNHSWSHPSFYELTGDQMLSQLDRTADLIEELTGRRTTLFRPPEGNCNSRIRTIVNAAGYEVICWTHETYDSRKTASATNSLKYSTKDVTGGSIILTHIDADCTVAVLRDILDWYRDNGFEVVTVGELLHKGETAVDEYGRQYPVAP